jgi:hypothetical protein
MYHMFLAKEESPLVDHDPARLPIHLCLALLCGWRGGRFRGERIQPMGQLVHCLGVDARCLEAAGFMVPDCTENLYPCLKVGLDVFCEDVALEWGEDADGVHLEKLIRTEVVPGKGKFVLEDGSGGKGEEDVLVDERVARGAGYWIALGVDGIFLWRGEVLVGVLVVFAVSVVESVDGGSGAECGCKDDGRDGALGVLAW